MYEQFLNYVILLKISKENECLMKERKIKIQNDLHKELGILVDVPTQGSGNTNDGNTARRFFNNFEVVSRITGDPILRFPCKINFRVVSSQNIH